MVADHFWVLADLPRPRRLLRAAQSPREEPTRPSTPLTVNLLNPARDIRAGNTITACH